MAKATLIMLPSEILRHIFAYLTIDQPPSDSLATGVVDSSFRGLFFACRRLYHEASDYYYGNVVFQCMAGDLVWETIHMNPDPRAVQAFSKCIERIQRLQIHVDIFQPILERSLRKNQGLCARIDLQLADLTSLRSCLEQHKPGPNSPFMQSLILMAHIGELKEEEVFEYARYLDPNFISEKEMYTAIFDPLRSRIGTFKFECSTVPPSAVGCSYESVVPF